MEQRCNQKYQGLFLVRATLVSFIPMQDLSGEEDVDEDAEGFEDGFCLTWPPKEAIVEIDDGYPIDVSKCIPWGPYFITQVRRNSP